MIKIYVHHFYNKSLFYILFHNTTDREYCIENDEGKIYCKYKDKNLEIVFKKEISYEEDGYHILDYFCTYFDTQSDSQSDTKFGKILPDRFYMDRENQQILKKFIELLKNCPKKQRWIITSFRTEKMLYSQDFINSEISENFIELELLYKQLSNHIIVNDNYFIDDNFNLMYPHFFYAFTNSIFQWNRNLNIRWYYEFKQIFNHLNFDYDLMYSVRNHKEFRVQLLNELEKLNIDKIYLQRTDELKEMKYFKKFGNNVSKNVKLNSVLGEKDFDDITYIQNMDGINLGFHSPKLGLDLFFRVLPKAKMQILCETWSYSKTDFKSQYLSEKTIGFILSGIPFISTHDYPILMIQKILDVPPHPFLSESSKCKGDAKLFSKFVYNFMKNFDENYLLCKNWSNLAFEKFMNKLNTENSLLDLILKNKFEDTFSKKGLI